MVGANGRNRKQARACAKRPRTAVRGLYRHDDTRRRRAPLESRPMPEQVTILGDGAMATVCSILLTTGGHGVTMWGAFEESIDRLIQDREQRRLLPGVR